MQYNRYRAAIETIVNTRTGLLAYDDAIVPLDNWVEFGWDWIYPDLSLLSLGKDASGAIILNPIYRWMTYSPLRSGP